MEQTRGEYTVSDNPQRLDIDAIHAYLCRSYWAEAIPRDLVERGVRGSLCVGLYRGQAQVGFARVVTDRATFAYLCDVYVLEQERGLGLGVWLIEFVMQHPELQGLRRWVLATRDAHELYSKFGWSPPAHPETYMEIARPGIYLTVDPS